MAHREAHALQELDLVSLCHGNSLDVDSVLFCLNFSKVTGDVAEFSLMQGGKQVSKSHWVARACIGEGASGCYFNAVEVAKLLEREHSVG